MKRIFKIVIASTALILMLNTNSFAIAENNIEKEMRENINVITKLLKDKKIEKKIKEEQILDIVNKIFDYSLMSRLTLGSQWKNISEKQQNEFSELFTEKLKNSYLDKLNLYTDEDVIIKDIIKEKETRIQLFTQLIGKDGKYDIIYKFYKSREGSDWMIYDVEIIGVSIMQTYRKQFAGILRTNTFDDLLNKLKEKNE